MGSLRERFEYWRYRRLSKAAVAPGAARLGRRHGSGADAGLPRRRAAGRLRRQRRRERHPRGVELLQPDGRPAPALRRRRSRRRARCSTSAAAGAASPACSCATSRPTTSGASTRGISRCRRVEETGVPGRKVKIEQMPPSPLPSATFDTAFAYSVFSHLSPKAHLAWQEEFARVVKPGALVFITTQARWFLDNCRELPRAPREAGQRLARRPRQLVRRLRRRGRGVRPRRDALRRQRRRTRAATPSTTARPSCPGRTSRSTGARRSRSSSSSPTAHGSSRPSAS